MAIKVLPHQLVGVFQLELWLLSDEKELHLCTRIDSVCLWELPAGLGSVAGAGVKVLGAVEQPLPSVGGIPCPVPWPL